MELERLVSTLTLDAQPFFAELGLAAHTGVRTADLRSYLSDSQC